MTNFTAIKPLGHVCNFIPNLLPKVTDIDFGRMKKRVNHGAILQYENNGKEKCGHSAILT